jgi:hypothetical protein
LRRFHRSEFAREITTLLTAVQPDVLMVYKGEEVPADTVRSAKQSGIFTVNLFPDASPHNHGPDLAEAMGEYDLVISTKPFHPGAWGDIYGYQNRCICVPHGYDPAVHYWATPPSVQDLDIVVAATWRLQYHTLMQEFARELCGEELRIGIIGFGWSERASQFPARWELSPALHGRAYGEALRRGRIAIAPVHRDLVVRGVRQPGDEDTTRTYNLAAAGCFFLHRRTPYVQTVYDELSEVPMWDTTKELVDLVRKYLPLENERRAMAARAHARAVPEYSIPKRAEQVLEHIRAALENSRGRNR